MLDRDLDPPEPNADDLDRLESIWHSHRHYLREIGALGLSPQAVEALSADDAPDPGDSRVCHLLTDEQADAVWAKQRAFEREIHGLGGRFLLEDAINAAHAHCWEGA